MSAVCFVIFIIGIVYNYRANLQTWDPPPSNTRDAWEAESDTND